MSHISCNIGPKFGLIVFSFEFLTLQWHTRIPGLWTQELDAGLWTLDSGCWTLGAGFWTLDAKDAGNWKMKTLESWTLNMLWTLGIGCWILDVKNVRSMVNSFQANVLYLVNYLKISKTRGFQRFSDDMECELQLEMN